MKHGRRRESTWRHWEWLPGWFSKVWAGLWVWNPGAMPGNLLKK